MYLGRTSCLSIKKGAQGNRFKHSSTDRCSEACLVIPQQEREAYVEHPAYNNCVDGLYQLLGIDLLKDEIMTYDKDLDHLAKLGLLILILFLFYISSLRIFWHT